MYKKCGCCKRVYSTRAEFEALKFKGEQPSEDETGAYLTEMRDCQCGSTIAVETRVGDCAESLQ
jgi:hypothetical protein